MPLPDLQRLKQELERKVRSHDLEQEMDEGYEDSYYDEEE